VTERLSRLVLADGRPASVLVGAASTVLAVSDTVVSSWDLGGRPYALVRETGTYRRGLDGRLLHKREATAGAPRVRERLSAADGEAVVEAARREAAAARHALVAAVLPEGDRSRHAAEAIARLDGVVAMDGPALAADAARFLEACGPVGILPPDQYLSLVVRITEGCSWDSCTFCRLYAGIPFRARTTEEVARHASALRAYFGPALALRRAVFLGDANALCLSSDRLLPLLDTVAEAFPALPLCSFVDAWTGARKSPGQWLACRERGLARVYVGLESGDPGLLAWLGKAGVPEDAVRLVASLHEAGVAAGVIVLLGAGGERFDDTHVQRTAAVLRDLRLSRDDLLYFSEYVHDPASRYGPKAAGRPDLAPLGPARRDAQRRAIAAVLEPLPRAERPRVVTYDILEFVY
jgi:hypothetical protein